MATSTKASVNKITALRSLRTNPITKAAKTTKAVSDSMGKFAYSRIYGIYRRMQSHISARNVSDSPAKRQTLNTNAAER